MAGWRQTQVRLTERAREAWDRECVRHGVTLTSLLEALGVGLDEDDWVITGEAVERARHLDRLRRSR